MGGEETFIMNCYRNIDRTKVQFDFLIYEYYKDNHYESEALSLGARVFRRPMRKENFIRNLSVLAKILKENPDIDIVHVHNSNPYAADDLLIAKMCGVKTRIAHAHGRGSGVRLIKPILQRLSLLLATDYLSNTPESAVSLFSETVLKRDRFRIFYNAIDAEKFQYNPQKRDEIRKQMGLEEKFVVLHVAQLIKVKNQRFLLEVFANAVKKEPNMVLLIAGVGSEQENLLQYTTELGLNESVTFLGLRTDIADLLQVADLFVFPSISEGLGIAAIEAQAAGLPCLLSTGVPGECKITDAVEFLPIDEGVELWVERMLAYKNFKRTDTIEQVKKAGYDIKSAAKELEDFYVSFS
jgi:glycosyltransferase involved in cell wall biosynthesis